MSTPQPPRAAVRLLERWLPTCERDELIGDLDEEFRERMRSRGRRRAQAWYWTQAIALALHRDRLTVAGLNAGSLPRRGPLADAATDWRHAWRSLRRSPGFSCVALASMVISLGLGTAVFSVIRTVLLQPVPVSTADRLVRLGAIQPGGDFGRQTRRLTVGAPPPPASLSDVMVGAWLARRPTLEAMTTYNVERQAVELEGEALRIDVARVGPEFFDVFPVLPRAGRTLGAADGDRSAPLVALVSERLLTQRVADPAALVGHTVAVSGRPHEIAGVLPFDFEWPERDADVWVADRTVWPTPGTVRNFGRSTSVVAVLRAGVTTGEVQREGQRLADELHAVAPDPRGFGQPPQVVVVRLTDELLAPVWPALLLLTFGTLGVIIAANVNLAGFLIARNTARHRDLALRRALGASSWRVIRPVLFEQILLAGAGAAGAIAVSWWVLQALPLVAPPDLPRLSAVTLDGAALAFAWLTAALTALTVGLAPARRLPGASLRAMAADGGVAVAGTSRRAEWRRSALVVVQVAMATLLLVGSVLVGRSLLSMLRIDVGYDPHGVLAFQVGTDPFSPRSQPGRVWDFYTTLQARLRAHPSVVSVGLTGALPLHGDTLRSTFVVPGVTPPRVAGVPPPSAHIEQIDATYLQTLGATLTRGRFFTGDDAIGAEPVGIVNEAFARTFLPGVDPLGQIVPHGVHRIRLVGVIAPVQRAASTTDDDPAIYTLLTSRQEYLMSGDSAMGVVVRTTDDPAALMPVVRAIVRELDATAPVLNMMPLETRIGRTFAQPRFFSVALVLFASLAILTALVGVYGVLSASVERRRMELGVRRALGAGTGDVVGLVIGRALRLAAVGLVLGILLAAVAASAGRSALYGIAPLDARSYLGSVAVILAVVLAGAWMPMRRALGVDPAHVLRAE